MWSQGLFIGEMLAEGRGPLFRLLTRFGNQEHQFHGGQVARQSLSNKTIQY